MLYSQIKPLCIIKIILASIQQFITTGYSVLIIQLSQYHPPEVWSVFKPSPSGLLKVFSAFYSTLESDESRTNSLDITAEFQRTSAHSSSANLKRSYLNQSFTRRSFKIAMTRSLKKSTGELCGLCKKLNKMRREIELAGLTFLPQSLPQILPSLKRSTYTKITLFSFPLKEGRDMHNWGLDHMLQSEFKTGWRCSVCVSWAIL